MVVDPGRRVREESSSPGCWLRGAGCDPSGVAGKRRQNLAVAATLEDMFAKGELEQALITFQTEIVRLSSEEIARMKGQHGQNGRIHRGASPPDARALRIPIRPSRMKSVTIPTLLLLGRDTRSPYARRRLPHSATRCLRRR